MQLFLLIEVKLLGTNISLIFILIILTLSSYPTIRTALFILQCIFTFAQGTSSQVDIIADKLLMTYTCYSASN